MKEHFVRLDTRTSETLSWSVRVPTDSPFFAGHFPGRPILPAVAELALAEDLAREALGAGRAILAIPSMRFRAPVGPGDEITVSLGARESDGARALTLRRGDETVARGKLVLQGDA